MRHHNKNRVLGRTRSGRKALLRSLAISLIEHGSIVTTEAKAKELRPFVEKLVTKSKKGNDQAIFKLLSSRVGRLTAKKLVETISPNYVDREGGYTRITKLAPRKSDAAKMAHIAFVEGVDNKVVT